MEPIYVTNLFPVLDSKLLELLCSLTAEQWKRPATPNWTVHQVACHLLDGNLRRLSMARDRYFGEAFEGGSYQDLVGFLNRLNADWVKAMRRLSPPVLVRLLDISNREVSGYFQSLDPHGPASFAVAWAGESQSENWFDIAREYTEKWHHQQQIREATGNEGITARALYYPVLDTFMRALPHNYRDVRATRGSTLLIRVTGEPGGVWFLNRDSSAWRLLRDHSGEPNAQVTIPEHLAWKLFTKGLSRETSRQQLQCAGEKSLVEPIFEAIAIMG